MGAHLTEAILAAERFYAAVGKTTIRVNKEVPWHGPTAASCAVA